MLYDLCEYIDGDLVGNDGAKEEVGLTLLMTDGGLELPSSVFGDTWEKLGNCERVEIVFERCKSGFTWSSWSTSALLELREFERLNGFNRDAHDDEWVVESVAAALRERKSPIAQ